MDMKNKYILFLKKGINSISHFPRLNRVDFTSTVTQLIGSGFVYSISLQLINVFVSKCYSIWDVWSINKIIYVGLTSTFLSFKCIGPNIFYSITLIYFTVIIYKQ